MEGNEISNTLIEFIQDNPNESQLHEFKDGAITRKVNIKKGRRTVKKFTSAFANSEGGLLIVKVADDKTISVCDDPIGELPLGQWAPRLLEDMIPYMSPMPRIQVLDLSEKLVLIIACLRSLALIPTFKVVFTVSNLSLFTSRETRLGVVSYYDKRRMNPRPVNRFLRSFIDLQLPNLEPGLLVTRTPDMGRESTPADIMPFLSTAVHLVPFHPAESYFQELYAGVVLSLYNGLTVWYLLTLNSNIADTWGVARVDFGRPRVGGV